MTLINFSEDQWANRVLDNSLSREERIQAAFHLENALNDENIKKLAKALFTEKSPIVRHEIAFSLGECGHSKLASKYLMSAVENDDNIFVRHEAILALSTLGKEEFIPFIQKFVNDPVPEMAESAQIALERIKLTSN